MSDTWLAVRLALVCCMGSASCIDEPSFETIVAHDDTDGTLPSGSASASAEEDATPCGHGEGGVRLMKGKGGKEGDGDFKSSGGHDADGKGDNDARSDKNRTSDDAGAATEPAIDCPP